VLTFEKSEDVGGRLVSGGDIAGLSPPLLKKIGTALPWLAFLF
jgi:hypothetical protein